MPLAPDLKKQLRGIGHHLHPVVTVAGAGLSSGVCAEAERALADHELIKVRFAIDDRSARRRIAREFCERLGAAAVQEVGKIVLVYRPNPKADARLSNLKRKVTPA
jgi:RNA-binding protein